MIIPIKVERRNNITARRAAALAAVICVALMLLAGCREKLPPNTVKSPEDVAGGAIGALRGSAYAALASDYGQVRQFDDTEAMLAALRSGSLDCAVMGISGGDKQYDRVKPLRDALAEYSFSFVIAKENGDLKRDADSALETLRANGELGRMEDKYLNGAAYTYAPPEGAGDPRATLKAAFRADFAPYSYLDSEGGPAGLDIDVARAVCDILGVGVEFVPTDTDELVTAVRYGKADLALGGLCASDEGAELVNFSEPYTQAVLGIFVRG
jgi:ABC-type amino acid transport substrate-binding protein